MVGFCTIKCKGNTVPGAIMDRYSMDIADSIFIRKSHRRRGHANNLLKYLHRKYPENMGFSNPISDGMKVVLKNFLERHIDKRDLLWLCDDNGDAGKRLNIWMNRKTL